MTPQNDELEAAMKALDAGIEAADDESMPPGFAQTPLPQEDDEADEKAWRKFVRTNYAYCVLGIVLAPLAFLVRLGRWSMRTLWQHHVGGEFGGF